MLKTDYPIKFDDMEIIFPITWQESHADVIAKNTTEDGHDHITYTRKDKLKVSAAWKCTDAWVRLFKRFADRDSFELSLYDVGENRYDVRSVRINDFACSLIKGSYKLEVTNGTWDVSFTIEEY